MAREEQTSDTNSVIAKEIGDKGILELNRPKSLNAINYDMAQKIAASISKWQNNKSLIIIKGNGGRAFSAGGDVKTYVTAKDPFEAGKKVFRLMFPIVQGAGNMNIPCVALIDGIVMGGAVGFAMAAKYRIATEKTHFAMPEVALGNSVDAGASFFLPRLAHKLGYYLALTGSRLKGADVWHAGIATHYSLSNKISEVENALLKVKNSGEIETVLNKLCPNPNEDFSLRKHLDEIKDSFTASSVEEIFTNLEENGSEWAKETLKTLRTVSPTSLKVILRQLNLGLQFSLGECLQMEYRLSLNYMRDREFHEGVGAALFTKNKKPVWNPSRIEDVSEQRVLSLFRPLPNNEDLPINDKLSSKL